MIAQGLNALFKGIMAYFLLSFIGWFSTVMLGVSVLWLLFN